MNCKTRATTYLTCWKEWIHNIQLSFWMGRMRIDLLPAEHPPGHVLFSLPYQMVCHTWLSSSVFSQHLQAYCVRADSRSNAAILKCMHKCTHYKIHTAYIPSMASSTWLQVRALTEASFAAVSLLSANAVWRSSSPESSVSTSMGWVAAVYNSS